MRKKWMERKYKRQEERKKNYQEGNWREKYRKKQVEASTERKIVERGNSIMDERRKEDDPTHEHGMWSKEWKERVQEVE